MGVGEGDEVESLLVDVGFADCHVFLVTLISMSPLQETHGQRFLFSTFCSFFIIHNSVALGVGLLISRVVLWTFLAIDSQTYFLFFCFSIFKEVFYTVFASVLGDNHNSGALP